MNLQRFTEKAREAVAAAQDAAEGLQHQELPIDHLLLALGEQQDGVVPRLLRSLSVDPGAFAASIRADLATRPKIFGHVQVYLGGRLASAIQTAEKEAERLHDEYVSTEHLFLGCLEHADGATAKYLGANNLTRDRVPFR